MSVVSYSSFGSSHGITSNIISLCALINFYFLEFQLRLGDPEEPVVRFSSQELSKGYTGLSCTAGFGSHPAHKADATYVESSSFRPTSFRSLAELLRQHDLMPS